MPACYVQYCIHGSYLMPMCWDVGAGCERQGVIGEREEDQG